ncbi:MAG: hypothetical protein ACKO6E_00800, partial [Planctomycetota bacterium]
MRAHDNHRTRSVTLLSLQPLESRTPLAANVTTATAPLFKPAHAVAVVASTVRVQSVAVPRVTIGSEAVAAAAATSVAAKEAARAAAVAAEAGMPRADVAQSRADRLAGIQDAFGVFGRSSVSDGPAAGVLGVDLSVGDKTGSLDSWRDRYLGMLAGGQSGDAGRGMGSSVGGSGDVRAAAAAGKGKASDSDTDDAKADSDLAAELANQMYEKGLEEEKWARAHRRAADDAHQAGEKEDEKRERGDADRSVARAQSYYRMAVALMEQSKQHAERAAKAKPEPKPSERPAPDGVGTQPRRATPSLKSAPPRPASATRPAVDGGFT